MLLHVVIIHPTSQAGNDNNDNNDNDDDDEQQTAHTTLLCTPKTVSYGTVLGRVGTQSQYLKSVSELLFPVRTRYAYWQQTGGPQEPEKAACDLHANTSAPLSGLSGKLVPGPFGWAVRPSPCCCGFHSLMCT